MVLWKACEYSPCIDVISLHCFFFNVVYSPPFLWNSNCHADSHDGDIHETEYDDYVVSANLTWNDLHEMGAPMYKLSLCEFISLICINSCLIHSTHIPTLNNIAQTDPTKCFIDSYSTGSPRVATISALSVILFICILFLLYDYYVRREFMERHQLLDAKRRFIRYVSHEVRTPLNAGKYLFFLIGKMYLHCIQNQV